MRAKESPETIAPTMMTPRDPYLSTAQPTIGEAIPPSMLRNEYAPAVMARVQPNSSDIGLKNTPKL